MDWYYAVDGKANGPHPFEDIKSLCLIGQIDRDTLVWQEGFAQWTALGKTTEFKELFKASPPPIPSNPQPVFPITEQVRIKRGSSKTSRWIIALHAWAGVAVYIVTSSSIFPIRGGLVAAGSILAGWGISVAIVALIDRLELTRTARRIFLFALPVAYFFGSVAGLMLLNALS